MKQLKSREDEHIVKLKQAELGETVNDSIRMRGKNRRAWTILAVLVALLSSKIALAEFVVVDATGKQLGVVTEHFDTDVMMMMPINGLAFKVRASTEGLGDNDSFGYDVFYSEENCSGEAYIRSCTNSFTREEAISYLTPLRGLGIIASIYSANGPNAYYRTLSDEFPQTGVLRSRPTGVGCENLETPAQIFEVTNTDRFVDVCISFPAANTDFASMYQPPLSVVERTAVSASACCGDCDRNREVTVDEIITTVGKALNGCSE